MRTVIRICTASLALTAAAGNLLPLKFDRLDASGKSAGFAVFKARAAERGGKKTVELDAAQGHFVTVPVRIAEPGRFVLTGLCSGDADTLYAKITVGGNVVSRSIRRKYMAKKADGSDSFSLTFDSVPAGDGYLFVAPRGGRTGKLILGKLMLRPEETPPPAALRETTFPVPEIIDSDSERIEAAAALDIASGWKKRVPEPRLEILPSKDPGVLEVRFDTSCGKLETSLFPYNFRTGRLTCRLDREIPLPPETWTKYNQLSVLVRPDCPHDRSSLWFDVLGRFKRPGLQTAAPLRGGKWNKIAVNWSCLPPEEACKITGISLGFGSFGTPKGEDRFTNFDFKDFRLERVVTGTEDTWEVSSEKIALPQTGYAPGETKQALLSGTHPAEEFFLVAGNKKVFAGKLLPAAYPTGKFKIADFSAFRTPGTYRLVSGHLRSVPFAIGYDHLKNAAAKSRFFMSCMRMGTTTPIYPKHAHLADDARRSDTGEQIDVAGGWFDASDLCGFHAMAATSITRPLLATLCRFNVPELESEALWGGKLLNKIYEEKTGLPFTVISHFMVYRATKKVDMKNPDPTTKSIIAANGLWTMNKYYTDNIPGTGDERGIHFAKADGPCSPHDRLDFHYGVTAAGNWLRLAAKDRAAFERATARSLAHFRRLETADDEALKADGIIPFDRNFTRMEILRLENLLTLYLDTRDEAFRKKASSLVQRLLAKQERKWYTTEKGRITGWFNTSRGTDYEGPQFAANVLALYAENCADKGEYLKTVNALRIYADAFLTNPEARIRPYNAIYPMINRRPFKQFSPRPVARRGKEVLYGNFRKRFLSEITGVFALDALFAGAFLNDHCLQNAASEVLRYNLGENQSARSLMADVGTNFNCQLMSTHLGWIPGMMGNPDIAEGVMKLPYNRNCGRYEIYTQAQGAYTAALTILSSCAILDFEGRKAVRATDTLTEKVHETDDGRLILPGGTVYKIRAGNGPEFELPVVSGQKRSVSLKQPFISKAEATSSEIRLELVNPLPADRKVRINAFAENMRLGETPEVALKAGEKRVVTLFTAPVDASCAAAAAFWLDNDFRAAKSVML